MKKRLVLTTLAAAFLITGCASSISVNHAVKPVDPTTLPGDHYAKSLFRKSRNLWQDGIWWNPRQQAYGRIYVAAMKNRSGIAVLYVTHASHLKSYQWVPAPQSMGQLTVTDISQGGGIVYFTSSTNVHGTFNIRTQEYSLSDS